MKSRYAVCLSINEDDKVGLDELVKLGYKKADLFRTGIKIVLMQHNNPRRKKDEKDA